MWVDHRWCGLRPGVRRRGWLRGVARGPNIGRVRHRPGRLDHSVAAHRQAEVRDPKTDDHGPDQDGVRADQSWYFQTDPPSVPAPVVADRLWSRADHRGVRERARRCGSGWMVLGRETPQSLDAARRLQPDAAFPRVRQRELPQPAELGSPWPEQPAAFLQVWALRRRAAARQAWRPQRWPQSQPGRDLRGPAPQRPGAPVVRVPVQERAGGPAVLPTIDCRRTPEMPAEGLKAAGR